MTNQLKINNIILGVWQKYISGNSYYRPIINREKNSHYYYRSTEIVWYNKDRNVLFFDELGWFAEVWLSLYKDEEISNLPPNEALSIIDAFLKDHAELELFV